MESSERGRSVCALSAFTWSPACASDIKKRPLLGDRRYRCDTSVGRGGHIQLDVVGLLCVFFDEELTPHGVVLVRLDVRGNIDCAPCAVHLREGIRLAFGGRLCQTVDGDERGAARESFFADVRHACRNDDTLQRFAAKEGLILYHQNPFREHHLSEGRTAFEGSHTYLLYAGRHVDTRHGTSVEEGKALDGCDGVGDGDGRDGCAVAESVVTNGNYVEGLSVVSYCGRYVDGTCVCCVVLVGEHFIGHFNLSGRDTAVVDAVHFAVVGDGVRRGSKQSCQRDNECNESPFLE